MARFNLCLIGLLVFFCACENSEQRYQDTERFSQYWASSVPSKMSLVAQAAIEEGNSYAEMSILQDIMSGKNYPNINAPFIRRAFDPRWEVDLSKIDREFALRLGLHSLVKSQMSADQFHNLHPAILYSILATGGPEVIQSPFLKVYKLSYLYGLNQYGTKFIELEKLDIQELSNPMVWALAHFLEGDITVKTVLAYFYGDLEDTIITTRLAVLLKVNLNLTEEAYQNIVLALSSKSIRIATAAKWFLDNNLVNWGKLSTNDRLRLLALRFPNQQLANEYLADLLTFPDKTIAIKAARDLSSRQLVGGYELFFRTISENNNEFNRNQIIFIVSAFLEQAEKQQALVHEWFSLNPAVKSLPKLVTSLKELNSSAFSSEAILYLKNQNYILTMEELESFIQHKDPFVRAYAYSNINVLENQQLELLKFIITVEKDPILLEQLNEKLALVQ